MPRSHATPIAPSRIAVTLTLWQETFERLQYAQSLLSHANPSGDLAEVIDRALQTLIPQLEKRRFAATARSRTRKSLSGDSRSIPASVRRAVWKRDGGRCTFVSETSHRCEATEFLQYDHIVPVARGGESTVANLRLRCAPHNQWEAERILGAAFMKEKRDRARRDRPAKGTAARSAEAHPIENHPDARGVLSGLRNLGVHRDEALRATQFAMTIGETTLEERMLAALRCLGPKHRVEGASVPSLGVDASGARHR